MCCRKLGPWKGGRGEGGEGGEEKEREGKRRREMDIQRRKGERDSGASLG